MLYARFLICKPAKRAKSIELSFRHKDKINSSSLFMAAIGLSVAGCYFMF